MPAFSQDLKTPKTVKVEHMSGELVVKLKQAPGPMARGALLSSLQKSLGNNTVLAVESFQTDSSYQLIRLKKDQDLNKAIEILKANSAVEIAEPNYIYHTMESGVPNDADFGKLWGLNNVGQADSEGKTGIVGSDIKVLPLWQQGFHGSRNIVVAVIDTGIDWTHPDLVANLYTNPGEAGDLAKNGKDDDGNGFIDDVHGYNFNAHTAISVDDHGHGSHTAGTIGGVGNNGVGVSGVNWEVSLMPVKFLGGDGGGSLQGAIESINYARMMKVNIMSNSWGGGGFSDAMKVAIEQARDAGILFVAAAGNESNNNDSNPSYPASYQISNVISVAATDNQDKIADFSNYGTKTVHVAAPGVNVYSTVKSGGYDTYSGTSMACPHVSGIAALMMSVHPEWTVDEIKDRLIKTSDPVPGLKRKVIAKGRVNAYNAFYNIVPPSTEPDPSLWVDVPTVVESDHPYKEKMNLTWVIKQPGAKMMRVHFEKVNTEARYDFVTIEKADGTVVDQLTGAMDNFTTEYLEGDSLIIRLRTDNSVNNYGFKVDKIQYIPR